MTTNGSQTLNAASDQKFNQIWDEILAHRIVEAKAKYDLLTEDEKRKPRAQQAWQKIQIELVWKDISAKRFKEAKVKFDALPEKLQKHPEAQMALARIYQAWKNLPQALKVIEALPPSYLDQIGTIKTHSSILIDMQEYDAALKILKKADLYGRNIDILVRRLRCNYKLNRITQTKDIFDQITAKEKALPRVALEIAYMHCDLKENIQAAQAITSIPTYYKELNLVIGLLHIYAMFHEYSNIESVLIDEKVLPAIKDNPGFLIVYSNAMLQYQGDPQQVMKFRKKIKNILLTLLSQPSLETHHFRKIINIVIFHGFEDKEFKPHTERYQKDYSSDIQIAFRLSPDIQVRKQHIEKLLENRIENATTIRVCLNEFSGSANYELVVNLYQKFLADDNAKQDHLTWSQFANFQLNSGHYQEARTIFSDLLAKYPTDSKIYSGLAYVYRNLNNTSAEEQILLRGHTACPDDHTTVMLLGFVFEKQEKYSQLVTLYEGYIARHPEVLKVQIQLSYAYLYLGYVQKAKNLMYRIIAKAPDDPTAIIAMGHCLTSASEFTEANRHFTDYINHLLYWEKFSEPHACSLEKEGDFQAAYQIHCQRLVKFNYSANSYTSLIRLFQNAVKNGVPFDAQCSRKQIDEALKKYPNDFNLRLTISHFYFEIRNYALSKMHCESALQIMPDNENAKTLMTEIGQSQAGSTSSDALLSAPAIQSVLELYGQGLLCLEKEQRSQAKLNLDTLQKLYPQSRSTYHFGAKYYLAVEEFSTAQQFIDQLIKKFGGLTTHESLTLVRISFKQKKWEKAKQELLKILKEDPRNGFVLRHLAHYYVYLEQFENAIITCQDILKILPNNFEATYYLARIAYYQADYSKALQYLLAALAIKPEDFESLSLTISIYIELERYDDALSLGKDLQKVYPQHRKLISKLFYLYITINDLEQAKVCVETLSQLYPKNPNTLLCQIRYKLLAQKEQAYDEVEEIFTRLKKEFPPKEMYFYEYATFIRNRNGGLAAINLLEEYIDKELKNYPLAYDTLALLYINVNDLRRAKAAYKKGIDAFAMNVPLHLNNFRFLLYTHKKQPTPTVVLKFYEDCLAKFKQNQSAIASLNQYLYFAGLGGHIKTQDIETITQKLAQLRLTPADVEKTLEPAFDIMKILDEEGFTSYFIGGGPRLHYLSSQGDMTLSCQLNDIDLITNASRDVLQKRFYACKNVYIPHQMNFNHGSYQVDVNLIGSQIVDLPLYLKSLRGLSFDCLLMDKDKKILDPTGIALAHLQSRTLSLVNEAQETYKENPVLLFRVIRHLHAYDGKLDPTLVHGKALNQMAKQLSEQCRQGKITAEMIKILIRGQAVKCFTTMLENDVLQHIYPELNTCLKENAKFYHWFFAQLEHMDKMVNDSTLGLSANRSYNTAVYMMARVLLRHKSEIALKESLLDDICLEFFGYRKYHHQIREQVYFFYHEIKYEHCMFLPAEYIQAPLMETYPSTTSLNTTMQQKVCAVVANEHPDTANHWQNTTLTDTASLHATDNISSNSSRTFLPNYNRLERTQQQAALPPAIPQASLASYLYSIVPMIPSPWHVGQTVVNYVSGYLPNWQAFTQSAPITVINSASSNKPKFKKRKKRQ